MKMLYTAKEVLTKLISNELVTFSKVAFSKAVKQGVIPYHREDGVKSKMYDYDEVADAIKRAGIGKPPMKVDSDGVETLPEKRNDQSDEEYLEEIQKRFNRKPTLTDANIIKTIIGAKHAQLKLDEDMGKLISREQVESKAFNAARSIRDKILSIPERMANELATMSDPYAIKELLFKEFGILLDGFSKDTFI